MGRATPVIDCAANAADLAAVRELFVEYAAGVGQPCCFEGFEGEVAGLPGEYSAPHGGLLLARDEGVPAGCVALRRLRPGTGEIKRLYVRPAYRGLKLGRRLAEAAIDTAREAVCTRVLLDTLPEMREAISLYRALGFRETEPYLARPTPGSICFELKL